LWHRRENGRGERKKEKEKKSGKEWSLLFRCEFLLSSKYTEHWHKWIYLNSMDREIGLAGSSNAAKGGVLVD
jgi:hypothetical protein